VRLADVQYNSLTFSGDKASKYFWYCHFPQISGISSSTNEHNTHPYSKYIWPSIPQIFGLTVLITINIWVTPASFTFKEKTLQADLGICLSSQDMVWQRMAMD